MNGIKSIVTPISIAVFCTLMVAPTLAEVVEGSDRSFNTMLGTMAAQDTGSMWLDYYVEVLNQELANKNNVEPFGAAGAEGPVSGFDGYLQSFISPDTGSRQFNRYVDNLNHFIQEKQQ